MWNRLAGLGSQAEPRQWTATPSAHAEGDGRRPESSLAVASGTDVRRDPGVDRRAYYRVSGMLPIRVAPIAPADVEATVFDLSLPDPLLQPIDEEEGDAPLAARLRRIEEKLDRLMGALPVERPRMLSGRDRQPVVFSGSGLRLDVRSPYATGDAFSIQILLPPPYLRTLRAVGFAVASGGGAAPEGILRPLALDLRHMEPEERDALVAYSYDVQRFALRHRTDRAGRSEHAE